MEIPFDEVKEIVKEAGGKVFGEKIVIADNGSSGLGTEFCKKFADLIVKRLQEQNENCN